MDLKDADTIWNNLSWLIDSEEYPEINNKMERMCVILRKNGSSYRHIQVCLGNPSKKWIRQTLLKWAPELIENNKN